ncbi:hypothetical protein [Variovorax paradoxus]|uniref:hypothetical protein n=1 Tax=Variovorax paradoxus TaxID=34073 RepID=UPI0027890865|nr:hypothetical protein [Variovorax paradoxus]MDQ0590734.1 hypothetical protein [Variovorax paradoxus]
MTMTIHLELAGTIGGREDYRSHSEDVELFDAAMLESLRTKHCAKDWWLVNWYITEKRGFNESAPAKSE